MTQRSAGSAMQQPMRVAVRQAMQSPLDQAGAVGGGSPSMPAAPSLDFSTDTNSPYIALLLADD